MAAGGRSVITPNRPLLPPLEGYPRPSSSSASDFLTARLDSRLSFEDNLTAPIGKEEVRTGPVLFQCAASETLPRITQLEQNLTFLREQHAIMLSGLHDKIKELEQRNRELLDRLIIGNGRISQSSAESSPDTELVFSPKEMNSRSLQVEMLEKEVSDLKASLAEANTKNNGLLQLVEHQKKQLDAVKKEQLENDLTSRLEEAENLIKKLVKENDEQRKEVNSLRSQLSKNGGRYSGHRRGGGNGDHQRFPPLQTQNFWGHSSHKHKSKGPMEHEVVGQAAPSLPHLNRAYSQPSANQRHRYYGNGNHFYRGNSAGGDDGEGRRRYRGRGGGSSPYDDPH